MASGGGPNHSRFEYNSSDHPLYSYYDILGSPRKHGEVQPGLTVTYPALTSGCLPVRTVDMMVEYYSESGRRNKQLARMRG
jgi:hypothetical protein